MKIYYKNFVKSFNLLHVLLIGLLLVGICCAGENYHLFEEPLLGMVKVQNDLLIGIIYALIPLLCLVGFNLLKEEKISNLDLLRNGLVLGTIGCFGVMLADGFHLFKCIILSMSLVLILIQLIIRFKFVKEDGYINSGFKNYISSLFVKFNPLTIILLGVVLGVVAILLLESNENYLSLYHTYYSSVMLVLCCLVGVVLPTVTKNNANMIDVLMISLAVAGIILFSYSNFNQYVKIKGLSFAVLLLAAVYARGINYNGSVGVSSLKLNNYYGALFTKYDVVLPFVLASMISINLLVSDIVYPIISIAVSIILFSGVLIFNKFKSSETTLSDYFLVGVTFSSIMLIPAILNISFIMQNTINLVAVILNVCLVVFAIIVNCIRVNVFGVISDVEETEEIEEETVVEVPVVEEQPVVEEVSEIIEDVVEEESLFEDEDSNDDEEDEEITEEVDEEDSQDDGSGLLSIDNVNGLSGNKNVKRKFNTKLMLANDEAKYYYSEVKNYLQLYRANGRYSTRCETYRYKGVIAKVGLAGKSIKVYLALDPSKVDSSRYNFKDVSDKKQYKEVPVMIKVKSSRGLKYFKELVDQMMSERFVKPRRKYEPIDYTVSLIPNGEAIFTELGVGDDYIYDTIHVKNVPSDLPDEIVKFLPNIQGQKIEGDMVYATIHLDTLCNHFNDGDIIDITTLKNLNLINRGNALRVKARGTLDRKLVIFADDFDADAVKMILCTNGTAVKVIR